MRQSKQVTMVALLLCVSVMLGCAAKSATHPNQLNAFDGQAYDILTMAQASLNEAQHQFQSGALPQSSKPVYAVAAAAYNNAQATWKTYRAVLQGTQSGDLGNVSAQLSSELRTLQDSITALNKLGGHQ
jgi:hypothetical protein